MPIVLPVAPKFDDDESGDNASSHKSMPLDIKVIFAGIPVSSATDVTAHVEKPHIATVADLSRVISNFCIEQQLQQQRAPASASSSSTAVEIKLNLNGLSLTDEKMRIDNAFKRATGVSLSQQSSNSAAGSGTPAAKLFVSGKFLSGADAAANRNAAVGSHLSMMNGGAAAAAAAGGAARRDRAGGEMTPEAADQIAQLIASNPAMIQMMMNADPQLKEQLQNNPELRQQLSDPDTIRELIRSQLTRQGRADSDAAMRGQLGQLMSHAEGGAMLERALQSAGVLNDGTPVGGPTLADLTANNNNNNNNNNSSNRNNLIASLFGGGSAAGGGANPGNDDLLLPLENSNANMYMMPQSNFPVAPAALPAMCAQQPAESEAEKGATLRQKISSAVTELTEMGFDAEVSQLAAEEAAGDVEKALSLIEEWQT